MATNLTSNKQQTQIRQHKYAYSAHMLQNRDNTASKLFLPAL